MRNPFRTAPHHWGSKTRSMAPRTVRHVLRHLLMVVFAFAALFLIFKAWQIRRHRADDTERTLQALRVAMLASIDEQTGDTILNPFQKSQVEMFAKENGLSVSIVPFFSLQACIEALEDVRVNIVAEPVPTTLEMKHHFTLTESLYDAAPILVQRAEDTVPTSVLQLNEKVLTLPGRSPYVAQLKHLISEAGIELQIEELNHIGLDSLARLTRKGEVRYFLTDTKNASLLTSRYPELSATLIMGVQQPMSWIVEDYRKPLLDVINYWIEDVANRNEDN